MTAKKMKTNSKGKAVATKDDKGGLPDYLKNFEGPVEQVVGQEDIVLPRIRLLHGTSDAVEEFDNAVPGRFWHTGIDDTLGDSFKFVIAAFQKRYMLLAPREDGQGILATARDGKTWDRTGSWEVEQKGVSNKIRWTIEDTDVEKSGLNEYGTWNPADPKSPPAATLFYDYLLMLPEYPDASPVLMSLFRTGIKKAKQGINQKILFAQRRGRPMQALQFEATIGKETNPDGEKYFVWNFRSAGFADERIFMQARDLSGTLQQNYTVNDQESELQDVSSNGKAAEVVEGESKSSDDLPF